MFPHFTPRSLSKDRARQEQLARDRLAALKARREAKKAQQQTEGDANRQLEEALLREQEADSEEDRREALDLHEGGVVVLQEAILNEMEKKHCTEQEVSTYTGVNTAANATNMVALATKTSLAVAKLRLEFAQTLSPSSDLDGAAA